MQFKVLLSLILATSAVASPSPAPLPSPTPQYPSPVPPRAGYYQSDRPVYTAQREREISSSPDDDEPYPSTSSLGTAQTSHGAEEQENTGFVEPIDFKHLLRDVESSSKGLGLGASATNPLFASESKNSFSGFFGSDNKDPFADFGGGGLATASSERNHKNHDNNQEDIGFVDPNVQFRSLFDSSQTASNGFKPQDFLDNQAGRTESSRGAQTQTFPSYTYSGRKEDESPRFRSNYRQVESQDDDYSDNNREREDSDRDDRDDEGPSYRGGTSSSPRNNNNNQGARYSPRTEESSHRPQSTGRSGPKAAESKNPKCKKVKKTVDYENEDYAGFIEPEPDYDPSTYRGRYKRQSRQGRQSKNNKRPMTCYVCEDEQGRYAERCSYDSNANPKKGEYFHSSSSSFRDDGRNNRPSGKSDRHRRNPYVHRQKLEASPTTLSTVLVVAAPEKPNENKKSSQIKQNEPKIIEKRQSGPPDRYASNFENNGRRNNNNQQGEDFGFQNSPRGSQRDYSLPRGYIGNDDGGRVDGYEGPSFSPESGNNGQGQGGRGRNNDDFGFGGGGDANFNSDFNFGPPSDFGTESSASPSGGSDSGYNFDFSIPKEYDPDVQVGGGGNRNNRPNLDGSASNSNNNNNNEDSSNSKNFDIGYDDYVKRNFPENFGPPASSEASTFRPSSSPFRPSAGPPISHNPPSYRPRPRQPERENSFNQYPRNSPPGPPPPPHGGHRRIPEHTQPSYNFAPPPNFYNNGPQGGFQGGGGNDFESNPQNLNKMVENFSGRERAGCQKVKKGDMSCYVCRDARGMNKEECMYASNDPKNQKMAYHEVSEYSSDPPASILPPPEKLEEQPQGSAQAASAISSKTVASPPTPSHDQKSTKSLTSSPKSGSVTTRIESTIVTRKIHHENKSPAIEYDFDY